MESSLHRELKRLYAGETARTEVRLGRYIIDAIICDEQGCDILIEVQHGPLTAIRDKIKVLLEKHPLRVVKPLIAKKHLYKRARKNGKKLEKRVSPKRMTLLHIFEELVHMTRIFPHPNLTLEVPLVEIAEYRRPGHGKRRWRRDGDHVVEDQKLVEIHDTRDLRTLADLRALIECDERCLPTEFTTRELADQCKVSRSLAQQIAYVLRQCGATVVLGKQKRAWLYAWAPASETEQRRAS
jgi:hypoxanthine-guanine phosphoribosyltransferase